MSWNGCDSLLGGDKRVKPSVSDEEFPAILNPYLRVITRDDPGLESDSRRIGETADAERHTAFLDIEGDWIEFDRGSRGELDWNKTDATGKTRRGYSCVGGFFRPLGSCRRRVGQRGGRFQPQHSSENGIG